jgi:arylsulfatase A-like enzyme/tetratricopeptide (TPR) repeat protein
MIGAAVLVACAFLALPFVVRFLRPRPTTNVLFITLDTTRADHLGCYGAEQALTPALDRLAAEGVLFERAYSPAPLTLPAHASVFTGLYPPEHGLRTNGRGKLAPTIPTLAAILADRGYDSGAFVASFVLDSKFGLNRGFARYDDDWSGAAPEDEALHRQRDGKVVVDSAIGWLNSSRSKPFFCWVHLYDPHFPYVSHEQQFGERFHDRPYDGEIAYVDRHVKRLLDCLDEKQLAEKTLVVVLGDHGEGLGEHVERTHGYTLYNSTQHVPLILRMKGRAAGGHRHGGPVSLVDVFPTVLACLGLHSPGAVSGRSLAAALRGEPLDDVPCYAGTDDPFLQNGWSPLRSLTTERWKYIRTTKPELYDLRADPRETHNLADDDTQTLADLARRLDEIEQKLVVRDAAAVVLTADERRVLESLGYVAGGRPEKDSQNVPSATLPDVKDMVPIDVSVLETLDLTHAGKHDEARERLRSIVASAPNHVTSRIYLGEMLEHDGKFEEAVALYREALKIKPDCVNAHIHLGTARITQGRPDAAIAHLDDALKIDPESAIARYNLGVALGGVGRPAEAVGQLEEALRIDGVIADVRTVLAGFLLRMGRTSEAVQHLEREIEINPRTVAARVNLATLLAESRPQEALRLLFDARRIDPENAQAQYNLGALLLMQNRPGEAIAPLAEAVRLMPDHPHAAAQLERARRLADREK